MIDRIQMALFAAVVLIGTTVYADDTDDYVQAILVDGRIVSGFVDARSNAETLWLRTEDGSVTIASSFPRSQVFRVKNHVRPEVDSYYVSQVLTPWPVPFLPRIAIHDCDFANCRDRAHGQTQFDPRRIRSIRATAELGYWDPEPRPDGIELFIAPLNFRGDLVCADGTVHVKMLGVRRNRGGNRGNVESFDRWARHTYCRDFDEVRGQRVKLPFRDRWGYEDLETAPLAQLHVRFGVPGQGAFETVIPVVIRSWNPLRDDLLRAHYVSPDFDRRYVRDRYRFRARPTR